MDIDGKDAMSKPCSDKLDSLLLSYRSEAQGNDATDIHESQKSLTETKSPMPSNSSTAGSEYVSNPLGCNHGDLHSISELGEEFTYCTLNTEDPEIPSDDNIGSSTFLVPSSVTLKSLSIYKEVGYPDSFINNQRNNEPDTSLKKEDNPSLYFADSRMVRPGLAANIDSCHPSVGIAMKSENPARKQISAVLKQSTNLNPNPIRSKLVQTTMKPASDGCPKQEDTDAHSKADKHKDSLKSVDQEGDDSDKDVDDDDDDSHIPYFSDIETMILEMDLSPSDHDSSASREVSRYQHGDTKRTIMRLEQFSQSFMHRANASCGALAILYGHDLKHYIKKREVILGRATDDVQVDIDLGSGGLANKISRRQVRFPEASGAIPVRG